jgi:hypothetical protein
MQRHVRFEFGGDVVFGPAIVEESEKTKGECS